MTGMSLCPSWVRSILFSPFHKIWAIINPTSFTTLMNLGVSLSRKADFGVFAHIDHDDAPKRQGVSE